MRAYNYFESLHMIVYNSFPLASAKCWSLTDPHFLKNEY